MKVKIYVIMFIFTVINCYNSTVDADVVTLYMDCSPIEVTINSPSDNAYVPINHVINVTCSSVDQDFIYKLDTSTGSVYDFHIYYDDVTTGNYAGYDGANYHIWWTASEGSFPDPYGTSAEYQAPDYSAGNGVRNVTLTAHADDYNRGNETPTYAGADDPENTSSITLQVWQVTVDGTSSTPVDMAYYDGDAIPADSGGTNLGWVTPGSPTGATNYCGNTEIYGTKSSAVTTVGFTWYQYMNGIAHHKTTSTEPDYAEIDENIGEFDTEGLWIKDLGGSYAYLDDDMRHPNGSTDVSRIFLLDTPGFDAGASNNSKISSPDNWTYLYFYDYFCSYAAYGGYRVSNGYNWEVYFMLEAVSGQWNEVTHIYYVP